MAVTADRVIVELEAKLDRYEANVRRAEQKFDAATRAISADAKRMERQIAASSGAIGAQFRQLAGTVAAAFSAQQVAELADRYTRFTNQLKVAGLEGQGLADVQERLFAIAQKSGTPLELLGRLYGNLASLQKDLGTTSADSLALSQAVSNSIRVQGTSAEQAAGGILGLNQALGQTRVQTDEYNQILDGLRPLLQAAVDASDKYAGSLGRLKNAIGEGEVSGRDLFVLLQGGFEALQEKADRATLTISQSFTILSNALTKYIGEADQANGASAAVSLALIALADNLDTVTEALGLLAALMAGRFVAGMVAGAASTGAASTALFALQARAVGAATTMEALALTSRAAGASMLAAFGGPVGLAVSALAVGIVLVATRTEETAQATAAYRRVQDEATNASKAATSAAEKLASAHGKTRAEALAAAKVEREHTKQKLASAQASLLLAEAEAVRNREAARLDVARAARSSAGAGGGPDRLASATNRQARQNATASANVRAAETAVIELQKGLTKINEAINAVPGVAPAGTGDAGKKTKAAGSSGPTAAEINERFNSQLIALTQQTLSAEQQLTTSANERAELELRAVELARIAAESDIKATKEFSAVQRQRLLQQLEVLADAERERVERERIAQVERERVDVAVADLQAQQDILSDQAQLADTQAERRVIALRLLELQKEEERIRLEAIVAAVDATEAEKEIARRRLAQLDEQFALRQTDAERQTEGPLERYRRELNRSPAQLAEQAEQFAVEQLENLQNALSGAIQKKLGIKDPVLGGIIDLFIQQVILRPLADAFASIAGGGGGGLLGTLIGIGTSVAGAFGGGAFGASGQSGGTIANRAPPQSPFVINNFRGPRASGGHVLGGQLYRVNETGVEGFQPAGSGKIIPLGRMRGQSSGGVVINQTVRVDASNSVTPDGFADYIVERTRKETTDIVAYANKRTIQNVPARVAQYQRDGT